MVRAHLESQGKAVGGELPGLGDLTLHLTGSAGEMAFDNLEDGAVVVPDLEDENLVALTLAQTIRIVTTPSS